MSESGSSTHEDERGPHWVSRAAFQIISLFFFTTEALLAVAVARDWIWLAIPLALVASHFMHGSLIGFHEASHGLLRSNKRVNDIEGMMIGVFSLMSFTLYRVSHQTHHMYLSTERDEELWPFVRTDKPRWFRCLAAFLELNLGIVYTPFLFLRTFLRKDTKIRSHRVRKRIWAEYAFSAAFWAAILTTAALLDGWKYVFWLYLVPAFIAANLQSWRKFIEHVGMTGNTVNGCTRSIVADNWAGRLVSFTLLHEPFHAVHHKRSGLPHAELPFRIDDLKPEAPGEREPFPSYWHALIDLVHQLADPRVGGHWNQERQRDTASHDALSAGIHSESPRQ